ncbi:MAG: hypothetical protein IK137_00310 [Bacilli bacterium]|nr:hypothetical protein [Bacilli bacterium]
MKNTNEEKRYKIEKIESGIKNAALYECAKTAMYIGLFAAAGTVSNVLTKDYNMDLRTKYAPMYEQVIGCILYATSLISAVGTFKGLIGLFELPFLAKSVKESRKRGEESVSFKQLDYEEGPVFDQRERLQKVILSGFFEEDKETISEGDTKKR